MASRARLSDTDPLYKACQRDDPAAVAEHIRRHGGRVDICDTFGWTALHHASSHGKPRAVDALLAMKAHPNIKADDGVMPLSLAARWTGHVGIIRTLIAAHAQLDAVNNAGGTALHAAAHGDHVAAARVLLEAGADASIRQRDGKLAQELGSGAVAVVIRLHMTWSRRRAVFLAAGAGLWEWE
jgi:ankyrin repeat protein